MFDNLLKINNMTIEDLYLSNNTFFLKIQNKYNTAIDNMNKKFHKLKFMKSKNLYFEHNEIEYDMSNWVDITKNTELIAKIGMSLSYKFKKDENIIEAPLPKHILTPNSYIFTIGASVKNMRWILNPSDYNIFIKVLIKQTKNNILEFHKIN